MSLDRFHFLCRRIHQGLQSGESTSDAIEQALHHPQAKLFGSDLATGSIPAEIINNLKSISDPNQLKSVTETYAGLDFSTFLLPPQRLKRIVVYLCFLGALFLFFSTIYQNYVAPNFLSMYEQMGVEEPGFLRWYHNNWGSLVIGVIVLLALIILIALDLFRLFRFSVNVNGPVYRYLLPPSLKSCYQGIVEILRFPLGDQKDKRSDLSAYLGEFDQSSDDLKTEIEFLLRIEAGRLVRHSERYLRLVSAIVSVFLVLVILFFLISAYSPIFILGEMI